MKNFRNLPKRSKRAALQRLITAYLARNVRSVRGKSIPAIALYGTFIKRTGSDVSAKRFFRILEDNGYHSRPASGGDYYENLTFNTGELS